MSQVMDRSTENHDEDRASISSMEKTPTKMKQTLGVMQSFRKNIRRAAERSPLSSGGKGSKVTTTADSPGNGLASKRPQTPSSPSLSDGTPVTSPLKNMGDETDGTPKKYKSLPRPKTDPNMVKSGDSFFEKGKSLYRSLRLSKDKASGQWSLDPVSEGSAEEKKVDKEEEKVVLQMVEEMYTLPEIPHTPLSVMQINKLIEMEVLEEAYLNLLAMRREFQQEQERCGEDSPMELAKKEKDLSLLYRELRNKISGIVCDSNSLPSRNKGLLEHVARIIQEEEKRAEEPGGLPGSWMEAWRGAVDDGVQAKVESIHLELREQKSSWLSVHLGLLGQAIVEDLEKVKKELQWSYPPSFRVFSAYVKSYHRVIGQHLKKVEPQVTELKDLHALLNWIINTYKSEKIMGCLSLQPEMKDEGTDLQLEDDFMKQLKDKYCCRAKGDMRSSLDKVTELDNDELWRDRKSPEKEEGFLISQIPMDIWTKVKGNAKNSRVIDAQLEQEVISSCLEELKEFPKRFEAEFSRHCSALNQPLWAEYQITYINSFSSLQQHMEDYRDTCPHQVEGFGQEVKGLITRLTQGLEDRFKEDVKPYLRRMMTRKWLTNDDDFEQLYRQTEQLSQHCALMKPPHVQEFASHLHYHVVREYIGQLMKNNFSCKNRRHENAANKIRRQWAKLVELFEEMESVHEWLYHVGDELCEIIGQKNKADIKNHLQPLVEHYPDFGRKHLVAVLNFRGLVRGREHQLILQRLTELKRKQGSAAGDKSQALFSDMQVTVNTDCLSNLPFPCLNFLLPDH
ncbi:exocyst complex component 3-like protein 4 [Thunnus thynnus]|uniref:exocyst complex component 3-like protein 4 n=1 Tax=Thunnus thynnus TaxID=8237 RepID=UPI0035291868